MTGGMHAHPMLERIDAYPTHWISGFAVRAGRTLPFGATPVPGGINFSVYSGNATAMALVLFQRGAARPMAEIPFPESFRFGDVFAMTVFGLDAGTIDYGYRAQGPFLPEQGHRFDPDQILADPYAKLLCGGAEWGSGHGPRAYRSRVAYDDFDWENDTHLNLPAQDLIIYELHVRGFTRDPSSGVTAPGTFAGLVEKIPYLRELGVNCVELMPVLEFDERDNPRSDPVTGRPLHNYWGYSPVGYFAPKAAYAATGRHAMQVDEFKNLVKHLHLAGIEVWLDVAFSHTGEGNLRGHTISFRGLDNATYYMVTPDGDYSNFSGAGNTLNCNHPVVRGFVLDCLRYWATDFHIDGFRIDLTAILGRTPGGSVVSNPLLLESLAHDPVLRDRKLVAQAWDAAGLVETSTLPGHHRWSEWNMRYRDAVRRFIKGDMDMAGELARRLAGSADLYHRRGPTASINFVTAHEGFTLHDLVSYDSKYNEANGDDNRDGESSNNSWNCGVEGPTDAPEVRALRARQVRNALLILLTSHGIPMLLAGDEVGRTQYGNNNAYCHDGPLSWFDWTLAEKNADLLRFVRCTIAFRRAHRALRRDRTPESSGSVFPPVSWHGVRAWTPDWSPYNRLVAAMFYDGDDGRHDCVYIAANAYWEGQTVELPSPPDGLAWHLFADTAARPPHDACEPGREPRLIDQGQAHIGPRSVLALVAGVPRSG